MPADYRKNDLFQNFIIRAKRYITDAVTDSLDTYIDFEFNPTAEFPWPTPAPVDSPLEAGFQLWWHTLDLERRILERPGSYCRLDRQHDVLFGTRRYRLDFRVLVVKDRINYDPFVAVELDGHEFHEKTKEQVADRNQRDRDLQAAGWLVFHFSGSEVVRYPERCIQEIQIAAITRALPLMAPPQDL